MTTLSPSTAIWKTADGQMLHPINMETNHIQNCIRLLERKKEALYDCYPYDDGDGGDMAWGAAQGAARIVGAELDTVEEAIAVFQQVLESRSVDIPPRS